MNNLNIEIVEKERQLLEEILNNLISGIGDIPIANKYIMPFGWRKAAKGRTVWRIVEEVISQNLENQANKLGFTSISPANSEVGVYDFSFSLRNNQKSFVNIKSAVVGIRTNKDDISKAEKLISFYSQNPDSNLYIATFVISFKDNMTIGLERCIVFPTAWIPDIYVNPSNNGNLQSSKYKDLNSVIKRTPEQFLNELILANELAISKKKKK